MNLTIPRLALVAVVAGALAVLTVLIGSGGARAAGHCRPRPRAAGAPINPRKACPIVPGQTVSGTFPVPHRFSPDRQTPVWDYLFRHKTSSVVVRVRVWNLTSVRSCRGHDCGLGAAVGPRDGGVTGGVIEPGRSMTFDEPNMVPSRFDINIGGDAYQNHPVKWRVKLISG